METILPRKLWTWDLVFLLGSTLLLWTSFYFVLAVLPLYVVQRLHGSPALLGLLSGILAVTAIVTRLVCGWALDRWGRRYIY
ncbi:MAG: MFS transporter, partial [Chloroflexi bacterium]|nr:MFS transporter [Chloroflexota bacterium]